MADAIVREPMPEVIEAAGVIAGDAGAEVRETAGAEIGAEIGTLVDALRRDGAGRIDAVRFRFIEALARRGAGLDDDAKRIVVARLATAVAECRARLEQAGEAAGEAAARTVDAEPAAAPTLSPLAALVRDIDAHSAAPSGAHSGMPGSGRAEVPAGEPTDPPARHGHAPGRELKSLRHFRKDWTRLGVEQQLARALAQGPRNAGPLNSHGLILQSLKAMRDLSPACLDRTMVWLDTLLWLDDATAGPPVPSVERPAPRAPADKPAPRAPADGKRKTVRTRAR